MLIVGLSGGIACGKTTVGKLLKELAPDIPIIDQDVIAREVVEPGKAAYLAIVKHFGREILLNENDGANAQIDRKKLGSIVFNDPSKRKILSGITKGPIIQETIRQILKHWISGCDIVVVDSPLLFESGLYKWTGYNAVVWISAEQQLERLKMRDNAGEEDAKARIASQMSVDKKRDLAQFVIDNSGSLEQTKGHVITFLATLRRESTRGILRKVTNRNFIFASALASLAVLSYMLRDGWR